MGENIIEEVQFRGQHKVPQDTLRALIYTKKGDVYDEESIHRDFIALWNTGRFDDLSIEKEKGPNGGIILRFVVTERRTVHTIDYTGNKSISKSEILDRFKDRKVNLSPESQYDPGKVQRAKNVLQEYEAERGHQYATVTPQIRQVPPGGVDITFAIDEGPKVKVGHIIIDGNHAFSIERSDPRDEEPEADRDSSFDPVRKPLRADLRFHQAGRRWRTYPAGLPIARLLRSPCH